MTNLIDTYLLKSGMPEEELCIIGRAKRTFYYYGITVMGATATALVTLSLIKFLG